MSITHTRRSDRYLSFVLGNKSGLSRRDNPYPYNKWQRPWEGWKGAYHTTFGKLLKKL